MKHILTILFLLFAAACNRPARELPDYYAVPDFTLTAQDGREFRGRSLRGKIWVADFIFANCAGPCPRMTTLMSQIQRATAGIKDVHLVSFTVDPARDTPEALAAYGRRYDADFSRWTLLTGSRETLQMLKREAFKLGDIEANLDHSTRLVLVDRDGRIRGFPQSDEPDVVARLVADIRLLAGQGD